MNSHLPAPDGENPEPSDSYWALVLEIDASLAEKRGSTLGENWVGKLPPDEWRRLIQTRRCLEALYGAHAAAAGNRLVDSTAVLCAPSPQRTVSTCTGDHSDVGGMGLGRFEVVREIGMGGSGVVFLARDPVLKRLVALKVPRPEVLLTPSIRRRFVAEGRMAAALTHPNIVTVYEAGEIGPLCYLAQAYIDGVTLARWLREQSRPVPARISAKIVAQLADGLSHAHARGILHRDVKPGNIMLDFHDRVGAQHTETPDERGFAAQKSGASRVSHPDDGDDAELNFSPKLTDFGIAKTLEPDNGATVTGAVLGTASYMSPEQAAGQNHRMGPASDVYSLGAVLYELLTGQVVFHGGSYMDTLRLVMQNDPAPIRVLRPAAPRDLDAICMKCLEKDPHRRYESAAALAADLRRYLRGEPTIARPLTQFERWVKWVRRRPAAAALIAVSTASVLVLLAVSFWYNGRLRGLLTESEALRRKSQNNERLAREREELALEHVYASEIASAQTAWTEGNLFHAQEILAGLIPGSEQADHRSLDWRYLDNLVNRASIRLPGHAGRIAALSFSPDGQLLASGAKDGMVRLWDATTWKLLRAWAVPGKKEVNAVAFSPDGKTLATATDESAVPLWEVATGKELGALRGHSDWVSDVVFSADGQTIATACSDKTLRLWNAATRQPRAVLKGHNDIVRNVRFLLGGKLLASTSEDQVLRLWSAEDGAFVLEKSLRVPTNPGSRPSALAVSRDGSHLAVCIENLFIRTWTVAPPGMLESPIDVRSPEVRCLAFSPNGKSLFAGANDAKICEWDLTQQKVLGIQRGHRQPVLAVAAAPMGTCLATGARDGELRIWTPESGRSYRALIQLDWEAEWMRLSPRGDYLALSAAGKNVVLVDLRTGAVRQNWSFPGKKAGEVAFASNGVWLMAFWGPSIRVWNIADGTLLHDFKWSRGAVNIKCMIPRSNAFYAAGGPWLSRIDVDSEREVVNSKFPTTVSGLEISSDGENLLVGGHLGNVWICDPQTLQIRSQLHGHTDAVGHFAFSPDRRLLYSSSDDHSSRLWDWETGDCLRTLADVVGNAGFGRFSQDGRTILASAVDSVYMWNVQTGRKTLEIRFPGHIRQFETDGRRLYVLLIGNRPSAIYEIPVEPSRGVNVTTPIAGSP